MLEPIPFAGYVEVDLPVKTYTGGKANYVLTDQEIDSLIMYVAEKPTHEDLYDFAQEVLKKAQEK